MLFHQVKKILSKHQEELSQLGVRKLFVFGSVARNEGSAKSDLDVLIDFDSKKGLFAFVNAKRYLEKLLGCEVDLVTKNALHPALKQKIVQEAK